MNTTIFNQIRSKELYKLNYSLNKEEFEYIWLNIMYDEITKFFRDRKLITEYRNFIKNILSKKEINIDLYKKIIESMNFYTQKYKNTNIKVYEFFDLLRVLTGQKIFNYKYTLSPNSFKYYIFNKPQNTSNRYLIGRIKKYKELFERKAYE